MEISSRKFSNFAGKSFNESLADGFKLFYKNYGKLILPLAFFQILLIVLDTLILTDFKWYVESIGINVADIFTDLSDTSLIAEELNALTTYLLMSLVLLFLQNLIGAIIITIAMCSVSNYTYQKYMGEDVSFKESFKSAFNKKIFIVLIILGFFLSLSSLLLFIPAIIVFGFFIFLVFTYNYEDTNPIKEAKRISKGAFSKVIGVFVVNFIFIYVVSFIYISSISAFLDIDSVYSQANINSWNDPATRNFGMIILYQLILSIVDILLAPLFICLLTTLFASLKARKDLGYYPKKGYYQESYPRREQESFEFTGNLDTTLQPNIPVKDWTKERFYCPFCGYLITSPKKFCPKCGESLDSLGIE